MKELVIKQTCYYKVKVSADDLKDFDKAIKILKENENE